VAAEIRLETMLEDRVRAVTAAAPVTGFVAAPIRIVAMSPRELSTLFVAVPT
jgi:hypothetical protein